MMKHPAHRSQKSLATHQQVTELCTSLRQGYSFTVFLKEESGKLGIGNLLQLENAPSSAEYDHRPVHLLGRS